ncbi:hypothetical protein FXO37_07314 [Capsicum annuum]|nr:hypothetical protein FXO37_07314 [Capsicum annuum]
MAQHANRRSSVKENQSKNVVSNELSSFSFGLTQDKDFNLGSTNIRPNEGVTFEELRSKHRNDPEKIVEIMKKKALIKSSSPKPTKFQKSVKMRKSDEKGECSKIASPVASDYESEQEKVEEAMCDQIYMTRVLPKFAPHIGCHTVADIEDRIKSMLTKNQYKMFCTKSIFDFFMKKKDCVVQAQLGRYIVSLETRKSFISAIVIRTKDTILHFTPGEFALVTDLNCVSNKDDFVFDEERPNIIIDQYFDIDTVAIPRLHFALVESDRYSDYPWGSIAFEELARSLHKNLKPKGKFYMLLGMPLTIQIWLYECCSNVPRNVASKVVFKNIEPTRKEISAFQIPKKIVSVVASHNVDDIDSDDDFQDPPQRQKQLATKKKYHVDPSASPTKKKLKPHPKGVDEQTPKRTPPPRAAKMPSSPAPSLFSFEDEDVGVSKKVFDKFREKVWQEFDDIRGLLSSRFDQMMNVINENKNKEGVVEMNLNKTAENESEVNDMDKSKLDQQYMTPIHIPERVNDESNADQNLPNSQITLPDELLSSLNAYVNLERSIIVYPSANEAQ